MKKNKILFLLIFFLAGCDNHVASTPLNSQTQSSTPTPSESIDVNKIGLSNISIIESSDLVDEENSLVKWEGRYEYKVGNKDRPSMNYLYHTATGFTVDFYGTSLEVTFKTYDNINLYFDYAIDDETLPNPKNRQFMLPNGKNTHVIKLAENLPEGHHTIKCLKMLEGTKGYVGVSKFVTDGKFYYRESVNKDNLKFMCVNASSGSGYGSLVCTDKKNNIYGTSYNSSSLHAYMYLTARRFNGDVQFVSSSGWGITYPKTKRIIEILDYSGVTPDDSITGAQTTGKWDYTKYVPDIIMFHIGGNDWNHIKGDSTKIENYKKEALKLVEKLHTYYPKAKMIYMHTASESGAKAIETFKNANILNEYIYEVIIPGNGEGETGANSYGAGTHPSFKTHIDSSNIMTKFIATKFRYSIKQENITYEQFEHLVKTTQ